MSAIEDKKFALSGDKTCNWRAEELVNSAEFRKEYATRPNVITAEEMPWENSPDGRIKHLIHRNMKTPELCVEAYMLFLDAGGRSGKLPDRGSPDDEHPRAALSRVEGSPVGRRLALSRPADR